MWIVLWIVSARLAAWGCEGSAQVANSDLAEVWARSLDGLADLQIQPHQRAWLKLTRPLGLVENTALIATPNEFVKEQLETRLRPLVTQALSQQLGRDIQLAVTVDPSPQLSAAATVGDLATEPGGPRPTAHPEPEHGARHAPPPQDPARHEPGLPETPGTRPRCTSRPARTRRTTAACRRVPAARRGRSVPGWAAPG